MPLASLQFAYYTDPSPGPTVINLGEQTVRLGLGMAAGLMSSAEVGQSSIASLDVDDPDGTWNFIGLHSIYAVEGAAPVGRHRLWTGIVGDREIRRGASDRGSLRTGVARVWSLTLIDHNEILGRRIIIGEASPNADPDNGNRPAETIAQRLTWLLGSRYLSLVTDQGHVTYPTNALDANNYDGSTPADVLRDMSVEVNYIYFAKHNETSGTPELCFFSPNDLTMLPAIMTISNVLSDLSSSCFAPLDDAVLRRDPSRVFSGAYGPYTGGARYRTNATTATLFGGWRDTAAPMMQVKTAAKADALLDHYLSLCNEEDDRITCTVKLPAANVNDAYEGEWLNVRFSHFPGYEDFRPMRILTRNVMADEMTDELYNVRYELTPMPSLVCSVQVSNVLTQVYDSGTSALVGSPATASIPVLADRPSVGFAFSAYSRDATDIFRCMSTAAPWTNIDGYCPNSGGRHTNSSVDQLVVPSGSASNWEVDWTPCLGDASAYWRVIGLSLATSATAPVQTGHVFVSGGTVTLGATPTPGNVILIFQVNENLAGTATTPLGFTRVAFANMHLGQPAVCCLEVSIRCVVAGDSNVITVDGNSYAHWAFVQEWALT